MSNENSNWVYAGGLAYELTEGDVICVFSQYGEIVGINLVRDAETGQSKGYCFICYEDKRSTELAVDNFNETTLVNRKIKVSYVEKYREPKNYKKLGEESIKLIEQGCAPKPNDKKPEVISKDDTAYIGIVTRDLSQSSSESIQFLERRDKSKTLTGKQEFSENSTRNDLHKFGQKPSYHKAINNEGSIAKQEYSKLKIETISNAHILDEPILVDFAKRLKKENQNISSDNIWSRLDEQSSDGKQGWQRLDKDARHKHIKNEFDSGLRSKSKFKLNDSSKQITITPNQQKPSQSHEQQQSPPVGQVDDLLKYCRNNPSKPSENDFLNTEDNSSQQRDIDKNLTAQDPARSAWLRQPHRFQSKKKSDRFLARQRTLQSPSPTRFGRAQSKHRHDRSSSRSRHARSPSRTRYDRSLSRTRYDQSPSRTRYDRSLSRTRYDRSLSRPRYGRSPSRLNNSRSSPRLRYGRSPSRRRSSRYPHSSQHGLSPSRLRHHQPSRYSRSPSRPISYRSPSRSRQSRSPSRPLSYRSPPRSNLDRSRFSYTRQGYKRK